jgi:DNA-binding transcriptional LysR family regulator
LERTPAGSHPTEAGRVVIASAERVLAALEDLAAEAAAVREAASSRLRVVASYTVAEHLLPEWVRQFRESAAWRGIEIEVEVANSTDVGSRVRAGRAAVGFVESPEPPLGLSSAIVGHDELVVVVPPTHPWAARRRPLGPSSLAATGLVVRERGSGTRESFEVALLANVHLPKRELRTVLERAALALVPGGRLLAIGHHREGPHRHGPMRPELLFTEERLQEVLPARMHLEKLARHRRERGGDRGADLSLLMEATRVG